MKAVLCKAFGPPEQLSVEEIPGLQVSPAKIVVSVKACSVNFPDVLMIQNLYQFKPSLPFSPGGEIAGIVKEAGEGVTRFKAGDRVLALTGWGGFAEEALVDARKAFPIPPGMDFTVAASVMYNYGTSYHALKDRAELKCGETLLVLGAGGGVGLAAVELGVLMGATVIAAASTEEKLKVCREKGAAHLINYAKEDLKERVKTLTGGKGADVVYDPVGDPYTETALRLIGWKGRYLIVGFAGSAIPKIPMNLPLLKGCSIIGVFWGQFAEKEPAQNASNLQRLAGYILNKQIKPHIHAVYALEEAPQAIRDLMDRKIIGKAVIGMDKTPAPPVKRYPLTSSPQLNFSTVKKTEGETLIFPNLEALRAHAGRSLGVSEWRAVTQEMINDFAKATADFQWIHIDAEKAITDSPYGKTIAHGFLTLSLSPAFMYELFKVESVKMGVNYGTNKVRFISPVPSGSRVRMKALLKEAASTTGGATKLIVEATFEIEGAEKPACVAELISMLYE